MAEPAPFRPDLSPVGGRPVHLTFDGGRLTSDAGALVLAEVERKLGRAERLGRCIEDPRAPERVRHGLVEMIRLRALMIAAGYADANDCEALRTGPAFKLAVGRLPESGADLCSQLTMCRLENLIKAHKRHLASDRTSCSKTTANPFRLLVHTAAYWLLHTLRGLAPKASIWRDAPFATIRLAPIKVEARLTELATRSKAALPSAYPYRECLARRTTRAAKLPP